MAAMTTALTEFTDNGNSRTFIRTGHTAASPRLVIQKRKVANAGGVASVTISTVRSTLDASGAVLPSKVAFEFVARYPVDGTMADVTSELAVIRDIINSDEMTASVSSQGWVK